MSEEQRRKNKIKAGMEVEAAQGDLGEKDISKPKVKRVIHDSKGDVKKLVVQKGTIFRKELEIPADRVQQVEQKSGDKGQGKVVVDSDEKELEALKAEGKEQLADEKDFAQEQGLLDEVEEALPTAEGLRGKETRSASHPSDPTEEPLPHGVGWLRMLGPGFLAGMAGNDSSAVATYAIDGAQNGFGHLWLLLLSTPMYQAVQYACAKLGQVTQKGLAEILREHYGRWVAGFAALVLVIANLALIAADLVAIGSGLELLTHLSWVWFVIPVAAVLWYVTVYSNFEVFKKIFLLMSLAFVVYIVTAILAKPNWSGVLLATFVPHLDFGFASISSAVALLGATISPYNIFWQVQGEKEEKRPGNRKQRIRFAALDVGIGVVSGNLIAYFIIVSTAATLFTHHKSIMSAADAAQALTPVLGPFAAYLFAIGLIGAGLVAIPVLLASTSYAVAGTFGWPVGLAKKPWQNEGFYLILTAALVVSLIVALLRLDPITLLFWANILSGILAPILVVYLIVLGNNRRVMHGQRLSWLTTNGLILTVVVMVAAAILLFYGLATGR